MRMGWWLVVANVAALIVGFTIVLLVNYFYVVPHQNSGQYLPTSCKVTKIATFPAPPVCPPPPPTATEFNATYFPAVGVVTSSAGLVGDVAPRGTSTTWVCAVVQVRYYISDGSSKLGVLYAAPPEKADADGTQECDCAVCGYQQLPAPKTSEGLERDPTNTTPSSRRHGGGRLTRLNRGKKNDTTVAKYDINTENLDVSNTLDLASSNGQDGLSHALDTHDHGNHSSRHFPHSSGGSNNNHTGRSYINHGSTLPRITMDSVNDAGEDTVIVVDDTTVRKGANIRCIYSNPKYNPLNGMGPPGRYVIHVVLWPTLLFIGGFVGLFFSCIRLQKQKEEEAKRRERMRKAIAV